MKWTIEDHDGVDKSFGMGNDEVWMKVDYDDVNHPEVDAAANYIKVLMENHWNDREFSDYYRVELVKQWNEDKYLQEEYPDIDKYVMSRL